MEENFNTIVRRAYVHYSIDKINARIDFSDEVRRRTQKMIREVKMIIQEEVEPACTRSPGRCIDCEYGRYCEGALFSSWWYS